MSKPKLNGSAFCAGGGNCSTCRSDARMRGVIATLFEVPPDWPACPDGKPLTQVAPAPSRGLGDTVSKVIKAVTFGKVKPCAPCKKRQAALNAKFPYRNP